MFFVFADSKTQRTHGRQAQIGNIAAARAVADIIRSTLGPRSMLKVREVVFAAVSSHLPLC
jgi:T-complex protein 1 subunit gamma